MRKFLMLKSFGFCFCVAVLASAAFATSAAAEVPMHADDRIKTMVFSEEEVYTILTKIGFSTAIELSQTEKIEAISLGDSVGWQITPARNRVFVKPLLRNGTTNLSIITNKRSYQFELVVSSSQVKNTSHAYVVRFFYPEDDKGFVTPEDRTRGDLRPISSTAIPEIPTIVPVTPVAPMNSMPIAPEPPMMAPPISPQASANYPSGSSGISGLPSLGSIGIEAYNFNYTLTGPEDKSPKKIFDDGRSTYFEYDYPLSSVPEVYAVTPQGTETPLNVRSDGNKYVVDSIAPRFVIRDVAAPGSEQICIFNEVLLASNAGMASPIVSPESKASF